jgi:hypothetical protein
MGFCTEDVDEALADVDAVSVCSSIFLFFFGGGDSSLLLLRSSSSSSLSLSDNVSCFRLSFSACVEWDMSNVLRHVKTR